MPVLLFFGGNGHARARLAPARDALERMVAAGHVARFDIAEVPYPGFEGRTRAADPQAFLDALAGAALASGGDDAAVYATGIGALFAVTLRAQERLGHGPLVLQGPVLWGLERRWMPRLARAGLAPVIPRLLGSGLFRRHFVRRHFVAPPPAPLQAAFFDGYRRCPAAADLFRWCGPEWLRGVESTAARRPGCFSAIEVWQGGRDRVVGPAERRWTEAALGVRWPEHTFPHWGHYPMIDDPEGWVRAVAATVHAEPAVMMAG